jgi:chromosome partitioning protein
MLVVIGFVSQKGGVGKSTLARALGAVAAGYSIRVKICDLDRKQQTVRRWEERRQEHKLVPVLEVRTAATASEAIATASHDDQLLIIDGPVRAGRATLEIARNADIVVQPSGPSLDDLEPAVLLFHELVRAGVPREKLVMALCRVSSNAEQDAARGYVVKAGYQLLPGAIPERVAYREAHNFGRSVTETGKTDNARADALMGALLRMITERVKSAVLSGRQKVGKRMSR